MKILFSWLAVEKDFINDKDINPDGLTVEFYRYHYLQRAYDMHILLRTQGMRNMHKASNLVMYLKSEFNFVDIEVVEVLLHDITDINEIRTAVESLLLGYKSAEIEIFMHPGTSLMHLVWLLVHDSMGLKTTLVQTIRKNYWKNPLVPEMKEILIEKSSQAYTMAILDKQRQQQGTQKAFITNRLSEIYKRAGKIAITDKVVTLILGDSGTGKELVAKFIHDKSGRATGKFMAINCAAFGESLLESRLFGHTKGAFTDAHEASKGIFLDAKGGTVFLDEIGDVSLKMQALLLRFLQNQEFHPVGGSKTLKTDVRIIAATNKNLAEICEQGLFRWDLYYRLHVAVVEMPRFEFYPVAERKAYIQYFVQQKSKELLKNKELSFTDRAMEVLLRYPFPGNFRELENLIEQLYVFVDDQVQESDLPERLMAPDASSDLSLAAMEKKHIEKVLKIFGYNITHTFMALGLGSVNTLKTKIEKYGLARSGI